MKKMLSLFVLSFIFSLFFIATSFAQDTSIVGKWKTIDEETNEAKSIVEVFEKDGKYFGKIVKLLKKREDGTESKCDKCPDDDPRKGQPTLGMEIIQGLEKDGDEFSGGTILDPEEGKIYTCKLWVEDGKLMVRGYIAFFFRTQTWLKAE